MTDTSKLLALACITGFVGDCLLQLITANTNYDWGLKDYFKQHGRAEATFIAGGMLTIFFIIYIFVIRLPLTYVNLAIYGVILDFIFRKTMLFSSLKGYYASLNYFWSAVWGAIPMVIPLVLYNLISKQ